MAIPIRSAEAIQVIINNGQHAIGDLGLEIIALAKTGVDNTDPDFRQLQLRIVLLRIYLQNMLDEDGNIVAYYQAAANEKKENNLLTGIAKLSGLYGGPAIPKITGDNIPLVYYPSSNTYINQSSEAIPGGVTFENTNVDAPGEVVDSIDASVSTYAFYIVTVIGTGVGEGSRGSVILVTWRGNNTPVVTEYAGGDVGGSTAGVTFSAALVNGYIELTCNVPTDNWIVRGSRISFYNISFQNVPNMTQLPTGGLVGQLLRKKSLTDFDLEYFTLTLAAITDITATAAELNYSSGVTSSIQTQINALTTALGDYLALVGGTMSGAIAMGGNKITGLDAATTNGDALRYEQLIGLYLLLTGGTMSGNIAMGTNKVTGLGAASAAGEAVRYEQAVYDTIQFIIDGGGSVITTGIKGDIEVPFDCSLNQANAYGDQASGDIVVDIWKDTYANFPPTDLDSITASAPITISSSNKSQDPTLTGWTLNLTRGDILRYNVDSITSFTRVTIVLRVVKS
jgi:hypothetical protein